MRKILAPVVADHDAHWVADCLGRLHACEPIVVHVLSVQPRYSGIVRWHLGAEVIEAVQREDALKQTAPLREALLALGIPHHVQRLQGCTAEEIARYAQLQGCRQIVIGPTAGRWSAPRLLGSIRSRVAQLMTSASRPCEVL